MELTTEQKLLVEEHMNLIPYIINKYINCTSDIDMRYEDLVQQGNLALCKAAQKYNKTTKFNTFAEIVVRNELLRYCKKGSKKIKTVDIEKIANIEEFVGYNYDYTGELISKFSLNVIRKIKKEYSGVVLKGLNAIELKILGLAGVDIAAMCGVKPNHVSAWIARAKKELMLNKNFLKEISCKF